MIRSARNRTARSRRHVLRLRLDALEERRLLSVLTVNTVDDNTSDASVLTLRDAITLVNDGGDPTSLGQPTMPAGWAAQIDNSGGGFGSNDTIHFNIPGAEVHTIQPGSVLPTVTRPVVIDGYSQPGSSPNTLAVGDNAVLTIELSGGGGPFDGLSISAAGTTLQGLVVNGFQGNGISVTGADAVVQGCYIGTDPSGTIALGNGPYGAFMRGVGSRLGTDGDGIDDYAERNLISGNQNGLWAGGVPSILIAGNYIGTDASGARALGNIGDGVQLDAPPPAVGVPPVRLGVSGQSANPVAMRNVISGNGHNGVAAWGNHGDLVIAGNDIGTGASGTQPVANALLMAGNNGACSLSLGDNTLVGSDGDGVGDEYERNIISGTFGWVSYGTGIIVFGSGNQIAGNYIGTDATGSFGLGQQAVGVTFWGGSHDNVLGYDSQHPVANPAAQRNVISGNNWGVQINGGAFQNTVAGNFIGTDATGTAPLPNGRGIQIVGGSYNRIGTDSDGVGDDLERNIISGNDSEGLFFTGDGDNDYNVVAGNYIGLDVTGTHAIGNGGDGVTSGGVVFYLASGVGNRIGVDGHSANPAAGRNVISTNWGNGRRGTGIMLSGTPTGRTLTGTIIAGNYIGTDASGRHITDPGPDGIYDTADDRPLGNVVGVWGRGPGVMGTRVGTDGDGFGDEFEGNVIVGSRDNGAAFDQGSTGTVVAGNWIGTNSHGDNIGNPGGGVILLDGTTDTQIGGPGPLGNTIAFNGGAGVLVGGLPTGNAIRGNSIHDNAGLGIDLGGDGVTPNGFHAGQPGPNDWQTFPVLSAAYAGSTTVVMGALNSTPSSTFTIDFYDNAAPDPTGYGQGRTYLGSMTVTTDASGNASFTATGLAPAGLGQWISATATSPTGDTSELCQDVKVTHALTTTSLTASATPSLLNQPVTFTATVTTPITGIGTPGDSVQFLVDNSNFGSPVPLSGGVATFSTSTLSVGPHTIQASYSGDSLFLGSSASLVQAVQYKFSGFQAPLNQNLTFALNRTIPIRFNLNDFNNAAITGLGALTSLQIAAGTASSHSTPFNPASSDKAGLHQEGTTFALNWQTKGLAGGNYVILLTLDDGTVQTRNLTLSANGASAGLLADGTANTGPTGTGALQGGDLALYVDNSSGLFSGDELARIDDAVAAVNGVLAPYGVTVTETGDSSVADVVIDTNSTTAVGGLADGVLGCETPGPAAIEITLVQGWNWYAGSDPAAVRAGQFDFETVVMHELGHALGLGHSPDPTSVMYATLAAGAARHNLNVADLNVPDADGGAPAGLHVKLPGRIILARPAAGREVDRRIEAELPAALAAVDQALDAWTSTSDPASGFTRSRVRTMWLPLGS
jgi:hypothetical protein